MRILWMNVVFLALGFTACVGSTSTPPLAGSKNASEPTPETVVATIGDRQLTLGQLDERANSELHELEEQRYQIRRQALEQMINQVLLVKEAQQQGLSESDYLKKEIESKTTAPTEAQIEAFFNKNAAQLPKDAKLSDYKERIVAFLKRQNQNDQAKELFASLRKKTPVVIALAPPPKPRLAVEPIGPSMGAADAKVVMVEFSDFECPFCARAKETVDKVMQKYGNKIRLVFRHFPLSFHPNAKGAAEAAACVGDQNKFWPFYDGLYADQNKLTPADLRVLASKVGADLNRFDTCIKDHDGARIVDRDMLAGEKLGIKGTPAFFINGLSLSGAQPFEQFEQIINQELAAK